MQMIKRKKLMPKTLIVLLSVVALGGFLPVNPGNNLIKGGEAWAGSLGARRGVGTSAGFGGGAVGAGPGAPASGAAGAPRGGVGTSAGVGGGAVGAGPGAPARGAAGTPVARPRGYVR